MLEEKRVMQGKHVIQGSIAEDQRNNLISETRNTSRFVMHRISFNAANVVE